MPSETNQPPKTPEKYYLKWNNIHGAVTSLAYEMKRKEYQPSKILAIARGGLAPAVILSHMLNIPEVQSIRLESYDNGGERNSIVFRYPWSMGALGLDELRKSFNRKDCLILDDIYDSGETIRFLKTWFPQATLATLYHKGLPSTTNFVHFKGCYMPEDRWIVFPWEGREGINYDQLNQP